MKRLWLMKAETGTEEFDQKCDDSNRRQIRLFYGYFQFETQCVLN